jgi:hypothetical protein
MTDIIYKRIDRCERWPMIYMTDQRTCRCYIWYRRHSIYETYDIWDWWYMRYMICERDEMWDIWYVTYRNYERYMMCERENMWEVEYVRDTRCETYVMWERRYVGYMIYDWDNMWERWSAREICDGYDVLDRWYVLDMMCEICDMCDIGYMMFVKNWFSNINTAL